MDTQTDVKKVLNVAEKAGHILLDNGAEIARVQDTMQRIAAAFGVDLDQFYILTNGIFVTGLAESGENFAKVKYIPVKGSCLDKVVAVNELSREIREQHLTLDEVDQRINEIRDMPRFSAAAQIFAAGIAAGSFTFMTGGSAGDTVSAVLAGLILYLFVYYVSGHLSKITGNLIGGVIVTLCSLLLYRFGLGDGLNHIISGAFISLVPGLAFTNGIRDIANGDYLSGAVRLLDALLVFAAVAIGIGATLMLWQNYFGGSLL